MFLFREKETEKLAAFSADPNKKAFAIYGRRRTGKTELILNFITGEGKGKCAYYQCTSLDYTVCLNDFITALKTYRPEELFPSGFQSFREVFQYLDKIQYPLPVIIIDEFPFIAKKNNDAVTEFQWIIDHSLHNLKLILLGSNRSFMRRQIADQEAPLYGRFDEILEVRPFSFQEVRSLFDDFEQAMEVYSVTGGVAQYVMFFKSYDTVEAAMNNLIFDKNGRLFQETENLMLQELRDPSTYSAVLRAIGAGHKSSGAIAKICGLDNRAVFSYLKKLDELNLCASFENIFPQKKAERQYYINDMLFRFHYTFIEPNVSLITALGPQAKDYVLDSRYKEYLGFIYEDIIRDGCYRYALDGILPFMPQKVGRWWGKMQQNGEWKESEIDVVAYDSEHILLGECKYRSKAVGLNELEKLKLKSQFVPSKDRQITYLLASRSGFTNELKGSSENVVLINEV